MRCARLAVLPLLCLLHAGSVRAQEPLVRNFGQEHGLAAPPVWTVAQDSTGFLWIGAEGGLFRFDGTEIRRWAAETIRDPVVDVIVSPAGRIVVREVNGSIFEVDATGVRRVPLPPAALSLTLNSTTAFDHDGVIWLIYADTVAFLDAAAGWLRLPAAALSGERPRRIRTHPAGGVALFTNAGIWRVERGSEPRKLYASPYVVDMFSSDADRLLVLESAPEVGSSRLVEIGQGGRRELISPPSMPEGRPISVVERHGTVWVSIDRFLVAVRPGQEPEVLGQDRGFESGGPLLIDREGSLWLGSLVGLHQYPEPETRLWTERDGLASRHTRFLAASGNTVWVGTWAGNSYVHRSAAGWTVGSLPLDTRSHLCADAAGTVWTAADRMVVEIRDTLFIRRPEQPATRLDCTPARDGGVWLGMRDALRFVDPLGRHLVEVASPPGLPPDTHLAAALHDSQDRVWIGTDDRICHAPAARLRAGDGDAWNCAHVPGLHHLGAMVELPSGALWAASPRLGILTRSGDGWKPLLMDDLPTRTVFALAASPRGGVWIAGHGILIRVAEREDGGWTVLERLTRWHGLSASSGSDVLETADGTLWIATTRGVLRIPAEVRFALPPVPPVALVEARVDDRPQPLDRVLRLPHNRNRVELRFAALSFRDPSQLRHQVRLGPNEPWSESNGRPSFRWVDLPAGEYELEYRASLDGEQWSAEPIRFAFEVLPAWYRATWFLALVALFAGAIGWSVYRARVAYLLGLERQRTRIAMDLHDEVGSGLASVGILSGVIAADGLGECERRQLAAEIAASAEELGVALSDIVWSLDPQTATLPELAARLAEHGGRLCADGEPGFVARFPEHWPAEPLDVAVRRNVLLVGLEALHNAARHAGAQAVVLSLLPQPGGGWTLSVRDDGVGFAAAAAGNGANGNGRTDGARRGRGLPGMRHRAEEIGALLDVRSAAGQGTTVTLRFGLGPASTHRPGPAGSRLRRFMTRRLA